MIVLPVAISVRRLARLGRCCGIAVAVVALVVMSGWVFDLPLLQRLAVAHGPMSASAAVGFLLLGVAVATSQSAEGVGRGQWVARTAALMATALGVAAMVAVASGNGLELWRACCQFRHLPACPIAVCFALLGVALLLPQSLAGTIGLQVLVISTGLLAHVDLVAICIRRGRRLSKRLLRGDVRTRGGERIAAGLGIAVRSASSIAR